MAQKRRGEWEKRVTATAAPVERRRWWWALLPLGAALAAGVWLGTREPPRPAEIAPAPVAPAPVAPALVPEPARASAPAEAAPGPAQDASAPKASGKRTRDLARGRLLDPWKR